MQGTRDYSTDHVEAECSAGALVGVRRTVPGVPGSAPVLTFRGIRYAGAARFEPPLDVEHWDGLLDATQHGPQAPQIGGVLERLLGASELPSSEDCLVLDVVTPACDGGARPVLVWVHGGAFLTGTGAMPWYDGASLARRGDVVVVTLNYRLGALGFLGHRNVGLLDQIAALRWVRRNIAAFGGDPDSVTVFGESAGGAGVIALMAMPDADGLFHHVLASSPSLLQFRGPEEGERAEATFLELLGVASVDRARRRPVEELLDAQRRFPPTSAGLRNFSPTHGTASIPSPIPTTAAVDRRPLVIGTNRDEMLLFTAFDPERRSWGEADVHREFGARFESSAQDAIDRYRHHRPGADANALVSAMQTDEMFRRPAQLLAERRVAAGTPTWMYEFDQTSPSFGGVLGACHGLDIPFFFHNLDQRGVASFAGDGAELAVTADQAAGALLAFARTGHPGWEPFDVDGRPTQRIGPSPALVTDPEPELRTAWKLR